MHIMANDPSEYIKRRDFEEAENIALWGLQAGRDDGELIVLCSKIILTYLHDVEGMGRQYATWIHAHPRSGFLRLSYGDFLANEKKDDAGARAQFREAIDIDYAFNAPHSYFITYLENIGDVTATREQYEQAIEQFPTGTRFRFGFARFLARTSADAEYTKVGFVYFHDADSNRIGFLTRIMKSIGAVYSRAGACTRAV